MKLKGLTKLALSGVALAAVAATLGTSTYAWYVANSKAEVSSISGTSNSTASGSLLINKLKVDGSNVASLNTAWTNKITATDLAFTNSPALQPVTRDMSYTSTSGKTGWHLVDGSAVSAANINNYVGYFLIGIKTTDANKKTVNMTWGIQNDTVTPLPQTAYVGDDKGAPSGINAGGSFTEDFIYALKFDWHVEELTAAAVTSYVTNGTSTTAESVTTTTARTAYKAESFKGLTLATAYNAANGNTEAPAPVYKNTFTGIKNDGNAHTYYKALSDDNRENTGTAAAPVYGSIIGGETETSTNFADISFNLPDTTKEYVLVVRYWLDGADEQCFDSCIGQTFTMAMKFESTTTITG
ncbi:MAG: hypothetical protein K6E20_07435 [Acholeplasmatales bacterium]|nr:hypothetical protein [Acholeplasmatales bacterium]